MGSGRVSRQYGCESEYASSKVGRTPCGKFDRCIGPGLEDMPLLLRVGSSGDVAMLPLPLRGASRVLSGDDGSVMACAWVQEGIFQVVDGDDGGILVCW